MTPAAEQFRDAIRGAGIEPPDVIEADGKLRRFSANGKRGDDAGWYVLHNDGIAAGAFGDWRSGVSETWREEIRRKLTPAEDAAHRQRVEAMRREREAEETKRHAEAATRAAAIWQAALPAPENHPYLKRKGIKPHGARVHEGTLVIPMRDSEGKLCSLQFIPPDGEKKVFLTGGRVQGCYYGIGKPDNALCIAEGFATAASVHEATGYAVAVAFNAVNLKPVTEALRGKFPDLRLILCADDDYRRADNPGLTKATEAAQAVGGLLAVPDFGADRPEGATDFNDLATNCDTEAIKRGLANAQAPGKASTTPAGDPDGWPEPLPLAAVLDSEPYPLDALPHTIRNAVAEVQAFTKSPVSLVASSALASVSLAVQALYDVKRADGLTGPVSLFLLTIADSGERKTTSDSYFTLPHREYEKQRAEAAKPDLQAYNADLAAWEAKQAAILGVIRATAAGGKDTSKSERELIELERNKPQAPRVPKLLRADETPENLAYVLAHQWPSGGIVSSEAGLIFGAHGMGKDSIMRNLTLYNVLWDGGEHSIGRRTTDCYTVRGARLTVGLQVQEPTLREFFERSHGLARGTGFMARFLVAWPQSTQGYRPFTDPPSSWPMLAAFNRRVSEVLNTDARLDDNGALMPDMLTLSVDAKAVWRAFHDAVEGELRSGGELYDVRDVASKAADNAARLAGLFHVFERGTGTIGPDSFEAASRIVAWHLSESRRFYGELALPQELANAARLDGWLLDHCRRERTHIVPTRTVQQYGPHGLRQHQVIEATVRELEDSGRARLVRNGRHKDIHVNPALQDRGA